MTAPKAAANDSTLTAILAKLARLEQRVAEQDAQLAVLTEGPGASVEPTPLAESSSRSSRRSMLGRVAAFAALGAVALTAGAKTAHADDPPKKPGAGSSPTPTGPKPAPTRAPTVNELIMGTINTAPGGAGLTGFENPGSTLHDRFFGIDQNTAGIVPSLDKIRDILFANYLGTAEPSWTLSGSHFFAASATRRMHGTVGYADDGVGVAAMGRWPLQIVPDGNITGSTAAPSNTDSAGNEAPDGAVYYSTSGANALWFRDNSSAWRRIYASGFVGVPIPITTPVRVLDTRPTGGGAVTTGFDAVTNAAIAPGAFGPADVRGYRLAGHFGIPTDVRGIYGNITLVDAGPAGGFVTVSGTNPPPSTVATLLPSGSGAAPFISNNFAYVQCDASGNIFVRNVGATRHIIIDVSAFLI